MANRNQKGIRWHSGEVSGIGSPPIEWRDVVSNYGSIIYEGSAVRLADDGTAEISPGTEGTPGLIYGIVTAIGWYWDAAQGRMVPPLGASPKRLPASTVYGSVVDRTSKVGIVRVVGQYFLMQADAILATATRAGALALRGTNGDHVISTDDTALDISDFETNDASATSAQWRLIDVIEFPDTDFTTSRVTYKVKCNENATQEASAGL